MIKAGDLDSGCMLITWKAHQILLVFDYTQILVYNLIYFHLIGVGPSSAFSQHLMKTFKH